MRLTIAPVEYWAGAVVTTERWTEEDGAISRAISTDVALDNEVAITDSGFSWGDMAMRLKIPYSKAHEQALLAWLQAWPQVSVARQDGLFRCVLQKIQQRNGKITVTLAVIERMA